MTRKQHRQKFLTPLTRSRKQNSHPFVVWNSVALVLLSGLNRFLLQTVNHAKRGWSVSPVPTGMAMRQSERMFFFRSIYCLLQWLSSKHGNLLKTVANPRRRTMHKDAIAMVEVLAGLSLLKPARLEWKQRTSERSPSRSFRTIHCIEALSSTDYGRWRVGRDAVPSPRHSRPGSNFLSLFVMDNCTYCKCKDTPENPLYHGAVWSDPFSRKPDQQDFAYCEECNNRGGIGTTDPHRFFGHCCICDREFWEYSEIYVLECEDPRNTMSDTACLRCIRNYNIENAIRCKCCGDSADGYYCWGFCRICECGCIGNAVEDCDNVKCGVEQP